MSAVSERYSRGLDLFRELHPKAATQLDAAFGDIAPDLMRYVVEFPFGEIYQRPGLAKRERQIATIACLATRGDARDQLKIHLRIGLNIGITRQELVEVNLQLIPYAGFPAAINAMNTLADLVQEDAPSD